MAGRAPGVGTSFLGDASRPSRPPSAVPSGSTTPFTHMSAYVEDTEDAGNPNPSLRTTPVVLRDSSPLIPAPDDLPPRVNLGPVSLHDVRGTSLVESPRPRPADTSSQTALPSKWNFHHSPSATSALPSGPRTNLFFPSFASEVAPLDYNAPPFAASTPWRPSAPPPLPEVGPTPLSAAEVRKAAKEAVDKSHLKDLLDESGHFYVHLRKPAEAEALFNDLNAPDAMGKFGTLFEEANAFVGDDLANSDVRNTAEVEDKESRFHLTARAMRRVDYVVEGLETLVASMLKLEGGSRRWKADHADSLLEALQGSASRGCSTPSTGQD
ncbi:uncharacterized protein C8Q71DRAFT_726318 [Rhodofomes roseus]|uniref:Uncharacterized protein n=1 Tax=Rhodofomes roseus TaxID=34475 RepID=A0ABQ8K6E8_9APHY|nr:uncharacterized protein C8Q71DRAFT_726826 [Rhodofomes roseus]XP_047775593.1 uncharacterized protein C8Q71DRAFT_726318 [Rhodofomes roseus]KAH9831669.1 hypothetical protein C8Q71DRAFT_726826 [Rhodofomes roseus]KAH9832675.1 hypothetical protein C8Q71DRAFT_726318 [Rhodofomes roseus]